MLCRFCPFAQRTWIALAEKGISFKLEEVAIKDPRTGLWKQLDEKPAWFTKLNPIGKVSLPVETASAVSLHQKPCRAPHWSIYCFQLSAGQTALLARISSALQVDVYNQICCIYQS